MFCAKSNRLALTVVVALIGTFMFVAPDTARAQAEPPINIPAGGPPGYDPNMIYFNGWRLYPTMNFFTENSNNFFLSPTSKISGWEFGLSPAITAEWSNGIHTTTIYGNIQRLEYPTVNELNATNGEATFTQKYSPLRDLYFTVMGDYSHQTLQSGLTNAIPSQIPFTGTTILPNGNIVLPNGTIVSPAGQVVGQTAPTATATPFSFVNASDQYTGTATVQKLFNYGVVSLGASLARTNYVNAGTANYDNKTFTEDTSFWLGPSFYLYTDGTFNIHSAEATSVPNSNVITPGSNTSSYRAIGGIGTRQFGLFRASAYFGHQGTNPSDSAASGGNLYGAALTYYPTPLWTISAHVDETINLAPANAPSSNLAISLPGLTPIQVATSSSTQTTSTTLQSSYLINQQWSAFAVFGYTHITFNGSPQWENTFVVDTTLQYNVRRNLKLTWDYQYSNISSNAPLTSAVRNLLTMSATYNF